MKFVQALLIYIAIILLKRKQQNKSEKYGNLNLWILSCHPLNKSNKSNLNLSLWAFAAFIVATDRGVEILEPSDSVVRVELGCFVLSLVSPTVFCKTALVLWLPPRLETPGILSTVYLYDIF